MKALGMLLVCAGCLALLGLPAYAIEDCWVTEDNYYGGTFQQSHDCSGTSVILINPTLSHFSSCQTLPDELGMTGDRDYECDMDGILSIGGQQVSFHARALVTLRFTLVVIAVVERTPQVYSWDVEVVQLRVEGGGLPRGCVMRESPTQTSTGTLAHRVMFPWVWTGVLEIFTDISIDGGSHWGPSDAAGQMTIKCFNCAVPVEASTWGNLKACYRY